MDVGKERAAWIKEHYVYFQKKIAHVRRDPLSTKYLIQD